MKQMETVVQDLVANKRTLFLAYECDVPLTVIDSELRQFLPRILAFLETYIVGKKYVCIGDEVGSRCWNWLIGVCFDNS